MFCTLSFDTQFFFTKNLWPVEASKNIGFCMETSFSRLLTTFQISGGVR